MPTIAAPHLFTRADYHKMVVSGVLTEDDRVELIEGEIVEKMPVGPSHSACVKRLNQFFAGLAGGRALVSVQDPLAIGDYSEPEPDLALLIPRDDFYAGSHPQASEVLLLIEVSDTSIVYDRRTKLPLYAANGIPQVWIVDLQRSEIAVYSEPANGRYAIETVFKRGQAIPLDVFPGEEFPLEASGIY